MNILFLEFSKINHIFSHEYFYNMRWHEISQLYIRMSYAIHTAREPGGRSEQYFMHARVSHFVLLTWLDMTRTFAARVLLDRLGSWDDGDATSIHVSCSRVQIFPSYPTCSQASLVTKTWSNWSIGKDLKHGCQLLLTSSFPQAAYHSCRLFFILRSFWSQGLAPTTWSFILTSQDLSGHQNLIHPDSTKKTIRKWHASPGRTVGNPLCSVGAECALCELGWGFQLLGQPSTSHVLPGEVRCLGDLPTDVGS